MPMEARLLATPEHRRFLKRLCLLVARDKSGVDFLKQILRLIVKRNAPSDVFFPALYRRFGTKEVQEAYVAALDAEEGILMRERCLAEDASVACHGCLSYKSQMRCRECRSVTFCVGCTGYGRCMTCEPNDT